MQLLLEKTLCFFFPPPWTPDLPDWPPALVYVKSWKPRSKLGRVFVFHGACVNTTHVTWLHTLCEIDANCNTQAPPLILVESRDRERMQNDFGFPVSFWDDNRRLSYWSGLINRVLFSKSPLCFLDARTCDVNTNACKHNCAHALANRENQERE